MDSIRVRVLLFAQVRLAAGESEVEIELPPGSVVGDAVGALVRLHPAVGPHLGSCRVAVGLDYAGSETRLEGGEEISLIPPVQGG